MPDPITNSRHYTVTPAACQWKGLPSHSFYFLYSAARQARVVGLDQGHASVWEEFKKDSRPLLFLPLNREPHSSGRVKGSVVSIQQLNNAVF